MHQWLKQAKTARGERKIQWRVWMKQPLMAPDALRKCEKSREMIAAAMLAHQLELESQMRAGWPIAPPLV